MIKLYLFDKQENRFCCKVVTAFSYFLLLGLSTFYNRGLESLVDVHNLQTQGEFTVHLISTVIFDFLCRFVYKFTRVNVGSNICL